MDNIIGIATKQGYAHRRRIRGYERYIEKARREIDLAHAETASE